MSETIPDPAPTVGTPVETPTDMTAAEEIKAWRDWFAQGPGQFWEAVVDVEAEIGRPSLPDVQNAMGDDRRLPPWATLERHDEDSTAPVHVIMDIDGISLRVCRARDDEDAIDEAIRINDVVLASAPKLAPDETLSCGCILGNRWTLIKHCGGHAYLDDDVARFGAQAASPQGPLPEKTLGEHVDDDPSWTPVADVVAAPGSELAAAMAEPTPGRRAMAEAPDSVPTLGAPPVSPSQVAGLVSWLASQPDRGVSYAGELLSEFERIDTSDWGPDVADRLAHFRIMLRVTQVQQASPAVMAGLLGSVLTKDGGA